VIETWDDIIEIKILSRISVQLVSDLTKRYIYDTKIQALEAKLSELVRKNHWLKTTLSQTKTVMNKAMGIIQKEKNKFMKEDSEWDTHPKKK